MNFKRFWLVLVGSALLLAALVFVVDVIPPTYSPNQIVDRATMRARALEALTQNDPEAEIVYMGLLTYEQANQAVGISGVYEPPFGATPETFPIIFLGRKAPVWVVAIDSKQTGHLPMFPQGEGKTHDVFAVFDARDGGMMTLRSSHDVRSDPIIARLRQLRDLDPGLAEGEQ